MATVTLSPVFNGWQGLGSSLVLLNGGLLNTYLAGSTTPAATYTTIAGSIQNTNPIVLNSDGRPPQEIWLDTTKAYKFVLTDSLANVLGTYDNIYPVPTVAAVQSGAYSLLGTVAGTNTITATGSPTLTAYASGQIFTLVPANTTTGATTLNIDGLGAKNVFFAGSATTGGELRANVPASVEYDGTQFNLMGPYAGGRIPGNFSQGTGTGASAGLQIVNGLTSGWVGLGAQNLTLSGTSNYSILIKNDGTTTQLNAVTGGTVTRAINNVVVDSVSSAGEAVTGFIQATGTVNALSGSAAIAGGAIAFALGSGPVMGIYFGSGAPSITAAKGSLYMRTDGSTTNDRMYVARDSVGTWTAVTTAA